MPSSPQATEIEDRLLAFLRSELLGPGATVHRGSNLLSGEVLDSMSVLRLAAFVGQSFGIVVQPADFVIDNFRDVAAIGQYVQRTLARQAGGTG